MTHLKVRKVLLREGLIWAQLSFHPNIAPFLGIWIDRTGKNDIGLVSEWMPNGNIIEYLKRNPFVPRMNLVRLDLLSLFSRYCVYPLLDP
jgi:serine/threonine protein kinase